MMFNKKGQSAMEFLLTYGWAILAVLLVISALSYLGIFNPRALIPDSCKATGQILCDDATASGGNGALEVVLTNNAGQKIKVDSVAFKAEGNSDVADLGCISTESEVAAGAKFRVTCDNDGAVNGDVYSGSVQVQYLKGVDTNALQRIVEVKVFQKVSGVTTQ